MIRLLMTLFISTVVLLASNLILGDVYYPDFYQPITVGLFLGLLAHSMKYFIFQAGTMWVINVMNFFSAFLVVYVSGFIMPGAAVGFTGAIFTAAIFTAADYLQHVYKTRVRLARKTK